MLNRIHKSSSLMDQDTMGRYNMDHKTKEVMEIVKGKLGYFKKLITVVLIVLLLIGCTSDGLDDTPKDDNESNVVTEKEASEYVYVHQQDEYDLKSLMNESGLSSEFEMSFKFESEFDLPKIQKDRMFENEEIYIDLDSEDADKIQNMLKDSYTENAALRALESKKILEKASAFQWYAQHLYETYQTDDTVSFTVYHSRTGYPGESSYGLESFTFNKSDGSLMDDVALLEMLGTNLSDIKEHINLDFVENTIEFYGQETTRNLVESMDEIDDLEDGKIYFRIKPTQNISVSDKYLYIVLEMYLSISGTFDAPIIYSIDLTKLK